MMVSEGLESLNRFMVRLWRWAGALRRGLKMHGVTAMVNVALLGGELNVEDPGEEQSSEEERLRLRPMMIDALGKEQDCGEITIRLVIGTMQQRVYTMKRGNDKLKPSRDKDLLVDRLY